MATVGNVTISGTVTGAPSGSRTFGPFQINFSAAVDVTTSVALTNGSVTVSVPTGATCAILAPPNAVQPAPNPSYAGTVTLKGVSGDTGVPVSNKTATVITWDTSTTPANFVLTASSAGTLEVWFA